MSVILPFQAGGNLISAPRRRNWRPLYWLAAAILLLLLQMASGTLPLFAVLVFVFGVLTYYAVRAVGGPATLMGACIIFMAGQNVLVSQIAKVWFWQPADKPLMWPLETLGIYCLAMAGIALAGVASRNLGFLRRKPLFLPEWDPQRLRWMAYIGTALSVGQLAGMSLVNEDTGQFAAGDVHGLITSMGYLTPLAVACGTAYVILSSQGQRSFGLVNGIGMVVPFFFGIFLAGREQMVAAFVVYYFTCWAFGFRFRPIHYAVLLASLYIAQYILFPYALYARSFVRTRDIGTNVTKATSLLWEVISDPARFQERTKIKGTPYKFLYFQTPIPTLERFSLLVIADGIVDATLRGGTTEMDTITPGFQMAVPRLILPDKPYSDAALARREPGIVGPHDKTTGIATGFVCDSFSSFGWLGALILPFIVSFFYFSIYRTVIDTRLANNVYALTWLISLPWNFSGTTLAAVITATLQGPVIFAAVTYLIYWLVNFATLIQRRLQAAKRRATVGPGAKAEGQLLGTRG